MSSPAEQRIQDGLARLVNAGHQVIWWSDPEGEFLEFIADLDLGQAEVIALADNPALAVKRRIELEGPGQTVVLYESQPAPEPGDDGLLDIRLYAGPSRPMPLRCCSRTWGCGLPACVTT